MKKRGDRGKEKTEKRGTGDSNFQGDGGHVPQTYAKIYVMSAGRPAAGQ